MNQNKNQLATTTGTRVALKNVSKSLKITNKLLAEINNFEKHWNWWLSLDNAWRNIFLSKVLNININHLDWFDKKLMKDFVNQIVELDKLDLSFEYIEDFSALEYLTNLTILDLSYMYISDISTLANLINIITIDLSENNINDITSLAKLTKLTELRLENNRINNISALSNLTNLKKLNL